MTMKPDYLPTIDLREAKVKPALFLDWDGTIRESKSGAKFIKGLDDIALMPNVESVLWDYRTQDWLICGVSNQGGVAYGVKTWKQDMDEVDATLALFESNPFHLVKTCWHHENGKHPVFGHRSLFRKPDIGMLVMCEFEAFNAGIVIDWPNSLMVGDRPEDEECARRAGIAFRWADEFFGRTEQRPATPAARDR